MEDESAYPEITKIKSVSSTKEEKMDQALAGLVANFTPLQLRYADYRAKGLKQSDAAKKAGSKATDRGSLGRVGHQFEQLEGMKEYISFLYEKRARASVLDEIELVEKARSVFDAAMGDANYQAANKSLELMCLMIGALNKAPTVKASKEVNHAKKSEAFNNDESTEASEKLKSIGSLMKAMKLND